MGAPKPEVLARRDGEPLDEGVPRQLVKTTGWEHWIDEDEEDIRVFDLGEAFLDDAKPEKLAQPSPLKSPETIFTDSFDSKHDLWPVGIMVRPPHLEAFGKAADSYLCRYTRSCLDQSRFNLGTMMSWSHKWFISLRSYQRNGSKNRSRCVLSPDGIVRYVSQGSARVLSVSLRKLHSKRI